MTHASDHKLRYHAWWTALGWSFVLLVIYLSLMPAPQSVDPKAFDAGHVLAYGWLMTWFAQIHRAGRTRVAIGLALFALGAALEFAQGMTGYRKFDYADMAMNALGIVVGLALCRTKAQDVLHALERSVLP